MLIHTYHMCKIITRKMEIQHVICYAFFVVKDYKILRIMEMGCIDMMNKYAELIVKKGS